MSGNLVAEYKNSTTYFVHKDHLGSARLVTGLTQNIAQNLDYLPFGELNSSDSGITTHKFTGDERDSETNLEHTWFRQHSSALGRWTTPDPAGLAAVDPTNPQSWNRYAYVRNNPLLLTDALGLTTCDANGNNCYDSVTVNGDTGTVSWADGGGTASWPCSGFVSIQCGPLPLPRVNKLISLLRKIGNYIPTVCGTGGFTYAGGRGSGGIASVGLYNISSSDSRTGHASGPFTDITVGELIQGGYGYATYSDGSTEHFGFAGVGGDVGVASANVSQYVSHVSGDSLLRNQFGLNIDFGGPLTGAGAGFGLNTDSMTSCFDHNFH